MSLFSELKRRNVFRVATAYVIVGWLLTEIVATLMPMFGVPDWVAKAIVIVVAVTFIPVLIFAWAYEMTPQGIKLQRDVDLDSSITAQTGKKLDYITIAAVVVGVGFLMFFRNGPVVQDTPIEITETSGSPSVAVLPFVNMSGNAENEYFSDGLTETLLHMLAQVPNIKVAARTSSFAFKGEEQDIRQIASALGVAHVLEGSVQRSGDKVRVTAQLIRAEDGFHVWSENYDRTLDDIFAIQDEIATDVGNSLTTSLLGAGPIEIMSVGTHDVIAYDLYLQALSHRANGSYGDLQRAEELLKEALLLDSDFHDARRDLAVVYITQQNTGLRDQSEAYEIASDLLEQVLEAQPNNLSARATFIGLNAYIEENTGAYMSIVDALPKLQSLTEIAPNDVDTTMLYARLLNQAGQVEEAIQQLERALLVDPVNSNIFYMLGTTHSRLKNWEAARRAFHRTLELKPDQPNAQGQLATLGYVLGDAVAAVDGMRKAMALDPRDPELPSALGIFLYRIGLEEHADYYRDRANLIAPSSPSAQHVVLEGLLTRGIQEESDHLARRMVANDIDERHGSFFMSVYTVLQNAIARENAAEGLEFVEQHHPGFNDPTSSELSYKVRIAQLGAFASWDAVYGREKTGQMADEYWRVYLDSGNRPSDFPESYMEVLALRGEAEAAIDFTLAEVVTKEITEVIWYREIFESPHLNAVVSDPRIQARFREWDSDLVDIRADVNTYLEGIR